MTHDTLRKGIVYMVFASFCFALMGAAARALGERLGAVELVLFRNLIGVIFLFFSVWKRPIKQVGGRNGLLIFRGIIGTLALFTFFYSITAIGLAEAITYQQTYPIFLALMSYYFLQEYLKKKEWIAIFVGFGGICFIFLPQMSGGLAQINNHFLGVLNAIMTAMAYLSIRKLSTRYDARVIILSFMLSGILLPIFSLLVGYIAKPTGAWQIVFPTFVFPVHREWLWIALLGFAALLGQIYLTKAFTHGKAGLISVAGYSNIVFSVFFGWLLGDAFPAWTSLVGIFLVILGGFLISQK